MASKSAEAFFYDQKPDFFLQRIIRHARKLKIRILGLKKFCTSEARKPFFKTKNLIFFYTDYNLKKLKIGILGLKKILHKRSAEAFF